MLPASVRYLPFIIVAMILAASGIAGLIVTLRMRARAFSAAAQLTLRLAKHSRPTP
jgi:putative ABC transport system permease protein